MHYVRNHAVYEIFKDILLFIIGVTQLKLGQLSALSVQHSILHFFGYLSASSEYLKCTFYFWKFQCERTNQIIYTTKRHRIVHKNTSWNAPAMLNIKAAKY